MQYTDHFNTKQTPQSQPIPGKTMVKNNQGGYSFGVSPMSVLKRFLILGTEGGSYYASEKKMTLDNAKSISALIQTNGVEVVETVVQISVDGIAPKNDAAIFVLALCAALGNDATKAAAYAAIPKVCRIGTHIFTFCESVQALRGWSGGLCRGVSKFYTEKSPEQVAMQVIKYRQRNGWTHRDVLRLAHPRNKNEEINQILRWAVANEKKPVEKLHPIIAAFEEAQKLKADKDGIKRTIALITEYRLPWEALPTEMLGQKAIWEAMLPNMPMTALVRNLAKMTSIGVLDSNLCDNVKLVVSKLGNQDYIHKSRLHPVQILNALKTYEKGHGEKGSLSWNAISSIVDALDDAFYLGFKNVTPSNKNLLFALDVSGSMTWSNCSGLNMTPREASAALVMVSAKVEPHFEAVAFTSGGMRSGLTTIDISKKKRLTDVTKMIDKMSAGGTDCSLPMQYATQRKLDVDVFQVYTDNETYHGNIHPVQALDAYSKHIGKEARLAVVAMQANNFSIAEPGRANMLDVVGFGTDTPQVLALFASGEV